MNRFVLESSARRLLATAALAVVSVFAATSQTAHAGVFVSVNFAPPALPVYVQPAIPGPGYIWTPGYWAYDAEGGYYWVPGTWVLPPYTGALWTPGYWGWGGGVYVFHAGYWGPHIGFYGGINYGFGYTGVGYWGGYWNSGRFYYNRTVNNVTNNITNVYNKTVINNFNARNISYNGGPNGVVARPTAQQIAFSHEQHVGAVVEQMRQATLASSNQQLRASVNHGTPPIAATSRAGAFESGVAAHAATTAPSNPIRRASSAAPSVPPHNASLRSASFAPQSQSSATTNHSAIITTNHPAGSTASLTHADVAPRHQARSVQARSAPHAVSRPPVTHPANVPPSPSEHSAGHNRDEHQPHGHR